MYGVKTGVVLLQLERGAGGILLPANAEVIEDYARGVRPIERVKMNTCNIIFKKIATLLQCVLNADVPDHFGIILARL